jgi:hypothetical protein
MAFAMLPYSVQYSCFISAHPAAGSLPEVPFLRPTSTCRRYDISTNQAPIATIINFSGGVTIRMLSSDSGSIA